MKGKEDPKTLLESLSSEIIEEIEDIRSKQKIEPEREPYLKWYVEDFEYSEDGVTNFKGHGEYITKENWLMPTITINEHIKKLDKYNSFLITLNEVISRDISQELNTFTWKLIREYLSNSKFSDKNINELIEAFLKDINDEPLKIGAKVELEGVSVLPQTIEFDVNGTKIALRQPIKEDLEKEYTVYSVSPHEHSKTPSAILNIERLGKGSNEIQIEVEKAIAILRLFKAEGANYLEYEMYSDSIIDTTSPACVTSFKSVGPLEKNCIKEGDSEKLKQFWRLMSEHLPHSLYYGPRPPKSDYLTIAYNRYCEALLYNGTIERKIANAVMGLEGLLLKDGEIQELSYRLKMRAAKILGFLGYDPYKVKEVVKDAYDTRSKFVHGGLLSSDRKKKLKRDYGDIRSFLSTILDYLRASLLINILGDKKKEELIDLIDNSLIDADDDSQLEEVLSLVKSECLVGE